MLGENGRFSLEALDSCISVVRMDALKMKRFDHEPLYSLVSHHFFGNIADDIFCENRIGKRLLCNKLFVRTFEKRINFAACALFDD